MSNAMICIRKMTDEDWRRLEAAARRFIFRHALDPYVHLGADTNWANELLLVLQTMDEPDYSRLNRLWIRCLRRAFREPDANGWGWDYVGIYEH